MAIARLVRCWSAASTAAGGRSRPASAAVPAASVNVSTRASWSAFSLRRLAAAGSAEITARRAARRSSAVVWAAALGSSIASTRAACSSLSPASSSAMTSARRSSMVPVARAAWVSGSRSRAVAMPSSRSAPQPVSVSVMAISSLTCSSAPGPRLPRRLPRAGQPAATPPPAEARPTTQPAGSRPAASRSAGPRPGRPRPRRQACSHRLASTQPGDTLSASWPCANAARIAPSGPGSAAVDLSSSSSSWPNESAVPRTPGADRHRRWLSRLTAGRPGRGAAAATAPGPALRDAGELLARDHLPPGPVRAYATILT